MHYYLSDSEETFLVLVCTAVWKKKMYIHVVYVCTGAIHTKNSSQCCPILPHVSRGAEWRDLGVPPHLYSNKGYIYLKFQ